MSRTSARRSCTVVLALGLALLAGTAPASAAVKTSKGGTAVVVGGTLTGGTLHGGTLHGGTLHGGTLHGGTVDGAYQLGGTLH